MVEKLNEEEWPLWYTAEWNFQMLDSITRRTGRLKKSIRLVGLKGFSSKQISRVSFDRDAAAIKVYEDFYPQALHAVYLFNTPSWFHWVFALFRQFLSKRFVEKFNVMEPEKNEDEKKILLQHIAEEHLPTKCGGRYTGWPYPTTILEASTAE